MVRFFEPFVFSTFTEDFEKYILRRKQVKSKRLKFSKESLDSFLNSAMNIEYVYLILLGINTYIEQQEKYDKICIVNKNNMSKIKFERVNIRNSRKWNVNDASDIEMSTFIDLERKTDLTMGNNSIKAEFSNNTSVNNSSDKKLD